AELKKTKLAALDLEIANLKKAKLTALDGEIAALRTTKIAALDLEIANLKKAKEAALNDLGIKIKAQEGVLLKLTTDQKAATTTLSDLAEKIKAETAALNGMTTKRQKADDEIVAYVKSEKVVQIEAIKIAAKRQFEAKTVEIGFDEYHRLKAAGSTFIRSIPNPNVKYYEGEKEITKAKYNDRLRHLKLKGLRTSGPTHFYYKFTLPTS
ncbi:MAG: hypothetical protein K2P93_03650, partial [Alphaproteobacteria bacterium]|nr:hypothetical protein [Alphaproteobacteria bacterium]